MQNIEDYLKSFSFFPCEVWQCYNLHFQAKKIDGLLQGKRLPQYRRGKLQQNQPDLFFSLLLRFVIKAPSKSENSQVGFCTAISCWAGTPEHMHIWLTVPMLRVTSYVSKKHASLLVSTNVPHDASQLSISGNFCTTVWVAAVLIREISVQCKKNSCCSTSSLHFHISFKDSRSSFHSTPTFHMPVFKLFTVSPGAHCPLLGEGTDFACYLWEYNYQIGQVCSS